MLLTKLQSNGRCPMTEAGHSVCAECGMGCNAGEYHPYAACLMFKQCRNSETVRANLQDVRDDSYQQGRVAGLEEAKNICDKLYDSAKGKNAEYYCALLDVSFEIAQQARGEKGVGDGQARDRS